MLPKSNFLPPLLENTIMERKRIVTLLNDYANKKLMFIQAPSGYGKRIAAAQFIKAYNLKYIWINLDGNSNVKSYFIQVLFQAFCEAFPELQDQQIDTGSDAFGFVKQVTDCQSSPLMITITFTTAKYISF
jgi:ATP/maltotriose-dependent transcriptional regulator MalT